jgi:hypothetical protein
MVRKSYRWWAKFPNSFYAGNFDFKRPVTEKEARAEIRSWLNGQKIPKGTQIYPDKLVGGR